MNQNLKGILIFFGIMVVVVSIALLAYETTGSMGIEERYNHAVGLHTETGDEEIESGFSIEGNPILYVGVLVILGIICVGLYRRFTTLPAE